VVRGRKPKTPAAAALDGDTRKQKRQPKAQAPKPGAAPQPPADLDELARAHWDELAEPMARAGLLGDLDADGLAAYCRLHAAAARCWTADAAADPIVMIDGKPTPNPYLKEARQYETQLAKMRAELGLTAVSRGRLGPAPGEGDAKPEDTFLKFPGGKGAA